MIDSGRPQAMRRRYA